ncbi:MAG: glucokinase [Pseudomonadota bacterium]
MSTPEPRFLRHPVLVGDLGGTNARFKLVGDTPADDVQFETVPTANFASVEEAIAKTVLDQCPVTPRSALLAAAGPITDRGLDLTNNDWDIRPDEFAATVPVEELVLLNDFEAQALSLPYLESDDLEQLTATDGKTRPLREQTKVVLGPGTGLGVGLLIRAGGRWVPVGGEGGHVDMGPRDAREDKIWFHLKTVNGRISGEQLLCGDGLVNLYQAICLADRVDVDLTDPADISNAGLEAWQDDKRHPARAALDIFCTCLGRLAGDLALTTTATGGVYLGGGITTKILPFMAQSGLRAAFDDKAPHGKLMDRVATVAITHKVPALLGLAGFARKPDDFLMDLDQRRWRFQR